MPRNINENYEWVGVSRHSQDIESEISIAAANDEYVLITGETGVGKEVVARRVHMLSGRKHGIFLPVNCSAIPKDLAETEFFGHKRGAFTGADSPRMGYVETADRGTLFLDEIGAMPAEMQPKFLRFLEDGTIMPVGSSVPLSADVRIIAATNEDIYGSTLRRDIFYRLDVNHIYIKPLNERHEDVLPIAEFYLRILNERAGMGLPRYGLFNEHDFPELKSSIQKTLSQGAKDLLRTYEFPGNVRELENILRYAFYRSNGVIEAEHMQPKIDRNRQYSKHRQNT